MSTEEKELIFFAYQGRRDGKADENVDAITHAIDSYNKHQKTYIVRSWEEYTQTTVISKEVMDAIKKCTIFVADVTYLNHNVLFELGYAIAKRKDILILLNESIQASKSRYDDFILKNIRYTPLTNSSSITRALQNKNYKSDLLREFINLDNLEKNINDIFYIQSKHPNQASLELTQALNDYRDNNTLKLISEDYTEIQYKPLDWYFQNLAISQTIIIHFLGKEITVSETENAKNSFFAGIACGLEKKVLLLAPHKYKAPLDYYEILIQYSDVQDLTKEVVRWIDDHRSVLPSSVEQDKIEEQELNLIKLGIGNDIAEDEKIELLNYFVPTYSYEVAKKRNCTIIIGRKGSGKSAIYIKLLDDFISDNLNYVIDLRPESDELLENIELSNLYKSTASKMSFFNSIWMCVILSKLLSLFYKKISTKDVTAGYSSSEDELIRFFRKNEKLTRLNFLGVVQHVANNINVDVPEILNSVHNQYLSPLKIVLKNYAKSVNTKYCNLIILADNLDRTWKAEENLEVQSDMIQTLLQIGEKINNLLSGLELKIKTIVFLRKDIFDYIQKESYEPDKLQSYTHEVEWENYPNKLRELVENRFVHILSLGDKNNINIEAWDKYFDINQRAGKVHPYKIIESIITKRPRDLIYFVTRMFESAVNKNHQKVNDEDFEYAIHQYTIFLNNNLIAETKAEFPEINDILASLQEYHGRTIEYKKFCKIVKKYGYNNDRLNEFIATMFDKGYLLGYDEKYSKTFSNIEKLKEYLSKRRYIFFRKKVYIIAHAKYFLIKNKMIKSF